MPLWVSDFLGDTMDLDASEIGAYMLLLMAQWNRDGGSLPNDSEKLKRICRCGRGWPKVWGVLERFFQTDENGIYSKRLRLEAASVASKREVNAQHGALGGKAKALKSKDAGLANATDSLERNASIPEPEPEPQKDGGGEGACEISTFREQILSACNVDPVSGLTGQGGRQLGKPEDMAEANRWLELPGLTPETICTEVRRLIKAKRDGPPSSFKYFTEAMQRLSGALTQPSLTPIAGTRNAKPSHEQFDTAHREYARRVSAGAIDRGPDPSNPFAA